MARKDPDVAAILHLGALRLAQQLQQSIQAFSTKPRREDAVEADARTITALGRAGAAVGAMLAGAERAEALAIRRLDDIDRNADTDTDTDTGEGDEMDRDGRPSGRGDPEDVERVRSGITERITQLADDLEQKGILQQLVSIRDRALGGELAVSIKPAADAA